MASKAYLSLFGKDVATMLGYRNPNEAISDHVEAEDKLNSKTLSSLGQRGGWLINEPGVHSLILSSKLPAAKRIKHWITHDVMPSIRKHGAYITPDTLENMIASPDFGIRLLTELKKEREEKEALARKIERDAPSVLFAETVKASKDTILIGGLAKILRQKGVQIGEKRLFAWMRENGYLIKRYGSEYNMPTQKSMELGLFEVQERTITASDGTPILTRTPRVTGKGQEYFINLFLKKKELITA